MINGLGGLFAGFLMGYIAFTDHGHELGNNAAKIATIAAEKIIKKDVKDNETGKTVDE